MSVGIVGVVIVDDVPAFVGVRICLSIWCHWLCFMQRLINAVWSMVLMALGIVNHLHLTSVGHSVFCLNLLKLFRNITN